MDASRCTKSAYHNFTSHFPDGFVGKDMETKQVMKGLDYLLKQQKSSKVKGKEVFQRNFTSEEVNSTILFTVLKLGNKNLGESLVVTKDSRQIEKVIQLSEDSLA